MFLKKDVGSLWELMEKVMPSAVTSCDSWLTVISKVVEIELSYGNLSPFSFYFFAFLKTQTTHV